MKYKFKYRRRLFFRTFTVIGHGFNKELNRMSLYFEDGGILEVHDWDKCDCRLGSDWALAVKKDMEKKSGQQIVVDRNLNAN